MTHHSATNNAYSCPDLPSQLRGVAKRHYLKELGPEDAKMEIGRILSESQPIDSLAGFYRRSLKVLFPDASERACSLPFVYSNPSKVRGHSAIQVADVLLQHQPRMTLIPTRTAYCLGSYVSRLLEDVEAPKLFEFGVGTGIIGASALRNLPPDTSYIGGELDPIVSRLAEENFAWNGFAPEHAEVRTGDGFSVLGEERGFDLVVSNPPYYPERRANLRETRWIGPVLALDGGQDGMRFYRDIFSRAGSHVKDGGWVVVQTPKNLASRVMALAREHFPSSEPKADSLEPNRPHSDLAISVQVA